MDCSPPGSSVHGLLQARLPEWVAISFSTVSSRPRDRTLISCIAGRCFTTEPLGNPNTSNNSLQNTDSVHEERSKADEKDTTQGPSSVSLRREDHRDAWYSRVGRPQRQVALSLTIDKLKGQTKMMMQMSHILGTNVKRETFWEMPSNVWGEGHLQKGWGRRLLSPAMAQIPEGPCRGLSSHTGHSLSRIWRTRASHEQCWQQQVLEKILDPGEFWQVRETEDQCPLFRDTESRAREVKKIQNTLWIPIKIIFIESTSHMESKDPTSHPGLPLHHKLWALEKMSFFFS